jgi:hypothetical protein
MDDKHIGTDTFLAQHNVDVGTAHNIFIYSKVHSKKIKLQNMFLYAPFYALSCKFS